jgi:hypothetical protein
MNLAMTIRTESAHKARMVRAAVGNTSRVVRLEIMSAVDPLERRRSCAELAFAGGPGKYIRLNDGAALIVVEAGVPGLGGRRRGCGISQLPQFLDAACGVFLGILLSGLRLARLRGWQQLKDDSATLGPIAVTT